MRREARFLIGAALFALLGSGLGCGSRSGSTKIIEPPAPPARRGVALFEEYAAHPLPDFRVLAAFDIDGDGDRDLIGQRSAVSYQAPTVALLVNDGFGRYAYASERLPSGLPASPNTAASGDVDGDGDLDVVIGFGAALGFGTKNALLINDGEGKFVDGSSGLPAQLGNTQVVKLVDVDGDGYLDLFEGNAFPNMPASAPVGDDWLSFGDGRGAFNKRQSVKIGSGRTSRAHFADFDNDGDLDVLIGYDPFCLQGSCGRGVQPKLFYGDGRGGFAPKALPTLALWTRALHVADFDGDKRLDIIVSGFSGDQFVGFSNELAFWRNDPDKGFVAMPLPRDDVQANFTLDVDDDGDVDLLADEAGTRYWWLNNGKGKFTKSDKPEPIAGSLRLDALVDADGDRDLDFVGEQVFFNDGAGRFEARHAARPTLPTQPWSRPTLVDIDGDGHLDFVETPAGTNQHFSEVHWNDGTGSFVRQSLGRWLVYASAIGDVDGDGDLDIFASAAELVASNWVHVDLWFEQTSPRVFSPKKIAPSFAARGAAVALLDFDGDKDLDVILAKRDGTRALRNDKGVFVETPAIPSLAFEPSKLLVLDADRDGRSDLYVAGPDQDRLWFGSASGKLVDVTKSSLPATKQRTQDVVAGDLNHDGNVDLVVGAGGGADPRAWARVLINQGGGKFVDASALLLPPLFDETSRLALADLDDDGDLDLVRVNFQQARFYLNNQSRGFEEETALHRRFVGGTRFVGVVAGDLDGDRDDDLILQHAERFYLRNEQRDLRARSHPRVDQSWRLDIAVNPSERGTQRLVLPFVAGPWRKRVSRLPDLGLWFLTDNARPLRTLGVPLDGRLQITLPIPAAAFGQKISIQAMITHAVGPGRIRTSNALERVVLR